MIPMPSTHLLGLMVQVMPSTSAVSNQAFDMQRLNTISTKMLCLDSVLLNTVANLILRKVYATLS